MKLLIIFIIASIINVIISTIKSIMTVKSGKWASALINATYYGFYTWVVMLMPMSEEPKGEAPKAESKSNPIGFA